LDAALNFRKSIMAGEAKAVADEASEEASSKATTEAPF